MEELITEIQGFIYSLCIRMLWDRETSLESTQEILLKIITRLSSFQNKSSFQTWCYRVATNHLLDMIRKNKSEKMTFKKFELDLLNEQSDEAYLNRGESPDQIVILNELRLSCTTALLLCLDRNHRISYILGEILQLDDDEISSILDISKPLHRKRLQRSRKKIIDFTSKNCGFVSGENASCQCSRKICSFQKCKNGVNERAFTNEKTKIDEVKKYINQIEETQRASWHYRSQGIFTCPKNFSDLVNQLE